jgi:uncharacterized membrane protein
MDLLIIVALSLLLAPLEFLTTGAIRIVLGLAFVLFFPGYTLIAALFPGKNGLPDVVRLALAFGLSIVVTPLIGLVLNYSPWGLYLHSMLISITVFIFLMTAIAWFRRQRMPLAERFQIPLPSFALILSGLWSKSSWWDRVLTVFLMTAILGVVTSAVFMIAKPAEGEKFTEFYILGPQGEAAQYPQELALDEEAKVIIGMVNQEYATAEYSIRVSIDAGIVAEVEPVVLEQGDKWEQEVAFTPATPGFHQQIEFNLYKDASTLPYRTLYLWIDVSEAP